jgi:hypothetical protein
MEKEFGGLHLETCVERHLCRKRTYVDGIFIITTVNDFICIKRLELEQLN